jgi:hypothetical protein
MMDPRLSSPVVFAETLLGFRPDPIQKRILTADVFRGLINCSRQWGKSTVMAIKAVHEAVTKPESTILVLCPKYLHVGVFFENVRKFSFSLNILIVGDGEYKIAARFPNGSRIIGVSSMGPLRSYRRVSLLLVDEAAEVRDGAYFNIRPTLATTGEFGGQIWLMSTPQGPQGFFWHAWEQEGDRWTRFTVPATDCPRISPNFLAEEREILGARIFAQEYMCQFIDPPDCLLNREDVYAAVRDDVPGMWH